MSRIAAVVVLFNPELVVMNNIRSYIEQVEKIYVVDNSDSKNNLFVDELRPINKVEYIFNKGNIGIAAALNIGVKRASEEGFDYLLTMDQDSEATPNMVSVLLKCFSLTSKIALTAPMLFYPEKSNNSNFSSKASGGEVLTAYTSGNLVKLDVYKEVGGYREDFFIDYVDHEFTLRLNKFGYRIFKCGDVYLIHNLGDMKEVNLFFTKVHPTNHSPLRLYYRTRNRFYCKKLYRRQCPEFFAKEYKNFWMASIKMLLFEKNKLNKIKYSLKGYCDFRRNKLGKFES